MTQRKILNTLQTLDRGLRVLELLMTSELGPSEISRTLGLDRTVVHRILRTLVKRQLVEQISSGCYRANLQHLMGLVEGASSVRTQDWVTKAPSWLEELRTATGLSANLCVPNGKEMVYIMQAMAGDVIVVNSPPGTRRPLHSSAVGKAYLATLSQPELDELLATLDMQPLTPRTITSTETLKQQLLAARVKGYYVDDGESNSLVLCVAAPILNRAGNAIASIGVSGPRTASAFERMDELGTLVAAKAHEISTILGGMVYHVALKESHWPAKPGVKSVKPRVRLA